LFAQCIGFGSKPAGHESGEHGNIRWFARQKTRKTSTCATSLLKIYLACFTAYLFIIMSEFNNSQQGGRGYNPNQHQGQQNFSGNMQYNYTMNQPYAGNMQYPPQQYQDNYQGYQEEASYEEDDYDNLDEIERVGCGYFFNGNMFQRAYNFCFIF
jgi:hypothetical protein